MSALTLVLALILGPVAVADDSPDHWMTPPPEIAGGPAPDSWFPRSGEAHSWHGVEETLRERIGGRWGVASDRVVLEWSPGRDALPQEPREVRLLGAGRKGYWVVEVTGSSGTARRGVRAGHMESRWVAARELSRGRELEEADLVPQETLRWGPPVGGERDSPRPGWVLRSPVRTGQVLTAPVARPPVVLEIGDRVETRLRRGPVLLRMEGEARGSGAVDERVRVRLPTGKVVEGTIRPGPVVDVDL